MISLSFSCSTNYNHFLFSNILFSYILYFQIFVKLKSLEEGKSNKNNSIYLKVEQQNNTTRFFFGTMQRNLKLILIGREKKLLKIYLYILISVCHRCIGEKDFVHSLTPYLLISTTKGLYI